MKISNNSPFIQFMSNENGSSLILRSKYLQRCKDSVGTRCLGETISNRSENRTWVAHLERTAFGLNTSICDLAVVDHNGITTSAARGSISPADALGELCVRVGQEELHTISTVQYPSTKANHTKFSSVTLLAFPQALMTKGSLKARTATMSTPLALS